MSRTITRPRKANLITVSLRESATTQPAGSLRVDRLKGVIVGVKILGRCSPNTHGQPGVDGTEYTLEALRQAAPLYEGKVVNVDHPDRQRPNKDRSSRDRLGWLSNVQVRGDGLYGDLNLLKSDPLTEKLFESAERNPRLFGLSHNATGEGRVVAGKFQIHAIPDVRSVDVVADAGTTTSLFESKEHRMARRNRKPTTLRKIMESLKIPGKRLTQLWEMEGGLLKPDVAPEEQPVAVAEPAAPETWQTHLSRALSAIVDDAAIPAAKKQQVALALTDLLVGAEPPKEEPVAPIAGAVAEAGDEGEGGDEDEAETPAGDDEADDDEDDKPMPKNVKESRELAALRLCVAEKFHPTEVQLKSLVLLESEDRKAFIAEAKGAKTAGGRPTAPRSTPAGGTTRAAVTESAEPKDAKEFAALLLG